MFLVVFGCKTDQRFISDPELKREITERLEEQKELAKYRSFVLFGVLDSLPASREKELLEFLYAFMPLSDMANLDGHYFLEQVNYALIAREAFSWGEKVPNNIFLHFVLPYRVNNENPDSARKVFFNELKPRIANLSMKEAALEVNHWCHEKVNYHPSDIRTSSPLSTVCNARGRCGEESTFTVTAMRAVGIPARQIYTPRWAHSDDNHAWVEVWVDGEWYFLGACEPEPDLNMGWFAGPSTRAMLLHSKVFGKYQTDDDVVKQNERFTEINVLPKYAPSKRIYVRVIDQKNQPLSEVQVQFQLYNYAEFYPIATSYTNENGIASLLTGYGDLLIWASKEGLTADAQYRVADTDTLTMVLQNIKRTGVVRDYLLIPPPVGNIDEVSDSLHYRNSQRVQLEDSIRSAYEKTFIDSLYVAKLASSLNIDPLICWEIIKSGRGNWKQIVSFLQESPAAHKNDALSLLSAISEKDLHDTPAEVLLEHLIHSDNSYCHDKDIYIRYVLNPHISNELITAYKAYINTYFGSEFIRQTRRNIDHLVKWISDSVSLSDANTSRTPLFPVGVLQIRHADQHSRNIFFVAACRSFGIPSRLEAARSIPQVYNDGNWKDISFETSTLKESPRGSITIQYTAGSFPPQPVYYNHFTIGRFDGTSFRTLDYEFSDAFRTFPAKITVDTGQYILVTGTRLPEGTVLARTKYFSVGAGENVLQNLEFNRPKDSVAHYGKIDMDRKIRLLNQNELMKISSLENEVIGVGPVLVWIDPEREPSKHLINELVELKADFDVWSGNILWLVPKDKYSEEFTIEKYSNLPENSFFMVDSTDILGEIDFESNLDLGRSYPIVIISDHEGNIVYKSTGYKIGNGEQILKTIKTKLVAQ
jgi:transglutaminase-like putative cysteine protease